MRILGISGSLRRDSHNTRLLRAAAELLPPGAELEVWEQLRDVPPFDEDHESDPAPAVLALREAVEEADAVLFVTPEYNAGIPGQLKNAVDWLSRPYPDNAGKVFSTFKNRYLEPDEGQTLVEALSTTVFEATLRIPPYRGDQIAKLGKETVLGHAAAANGGVQDLKVLVENLTREVAALKAKV